MPAFLGVKSKIRAVGDFCQQSGLFARVIENIDVIAYALEVPQQRPANFGLSPTECSGG